MPRRRVWARVVAGLLILLIALAGAAWLSRERIAGNLIERQLRTLDIPATYRIETIGPDRQVLTDIVVGDPAAPDLTVERAEVAVIFRLGTPRIGRITLHRPRLFGTLRGGKPSFGTLDKVLLRDTGQPPGLPKLDVRLIDGRALIESDMGPIGVKIDGAGRIDDGFAGVLAATMPRLNRADCSLSGLTLYGRIATDDGKPSFEGPMRAGNGECAGMAMRNVVAELDLAGDADLSGVEGKAVIQTGLLQTGATMSNGLTGQVRASWRRDALTAEYTLAARGVRNPQASAALVTADGILRARQSFGSVEARADLEGNGLRLGSGLDRLLADTAQSTDDTLLAPLVRQARAALSREERASRAIATVSFRKTDRGGSLVVPSATLRGRSGATLLALSQVHVRLASGQAARLSGNLATGGAGLPRIAGRMERASSGAAVLRLRMAPYSAGSSALAIPELVVAQRRDGSLDFEGRAQASGPLPGGSTRNLQLPLDGTWSARAGLSLWPTCTRVAFDRLAIASLMLDRRAVTLCPSKGQPILRQTPSGIRLAAGAPSLDLSGRLAETPIRLRSGPVGFAYPGALSARAVDVALGPVATASTFRISNLTATFGREIGGTFADADVRLFAVPLDLREASGNWRYSGGVLRLAEGRFRLVDRQAEPRFNPLVSQKATLTLRDNVINANASLREPETQRIVTEAAIVHNLASGAGHADLAVPGLLFDRALQPAALFPRARGVIANTMGTVTGTGRIDWNAAGVTSRGRFSSESLDFAAAFGPVKGARGTIEFSDLLGLTTAPNQRIAIGSVNPGIEVTEGELVFALRGGQFLSVEGATWPFMGGTLTLRSTSLNLGMSEERHYIFEIEGLDAARFVDHLDLKNIAATGIFDGTLPVVFDSQGNGRIQGGLLIARPPGGNISYVGELNRRDLGTMANFAFDALRSLDYRQMSLAMDGNLTGEIVTRVRFDGVKQGARARRNFLTRRFESLPIRFNVTVRAPFYQLITSIKSMYDPASVRDPRSLGLLTDDGRMLRRSVTPPAPDIAPDDLIPDQPPVQTLESENLP
ncbi:exoprotein [Altererythrobacter aerius]|uniref:Exoprotein n=1 Tax=Tsuneonella aeria TaxID=1837929 RepID=A0A6I4T984_9SPHN|nr:YdbH domain-containing protein [Tsuneonella aeria]MXO73891.1 exoprotein [Tsuneonella aeria]